MKVVSGREGRGDRGVLKKGRQGQEERGRKMREEKKKGGKETGRKGMRKRGGMELTCFKRQKLLLNDNT